MTRDRVLIALALVVATAVVLVPERSTAASPLGIATPILDPGHRGLSRWFSALRRAADQTPGTTGVARALHFGDSTIAGDGISRTVRARLAARFGDAGPGFISASFNPKWSARVDVSSRRSGTWDWRTILLGGGAGRYGLGGIVGMLSSGAKVTFSAMGAASGTEPPTPVGQRHVEVWYQAGAGYGSVWATAGTSEILRASAAAGATEDRRFVVDLPTSAATFAVGASGGTVPVYGVVLETGLPGATWEAQGVVGVGSKSFTTFAKEHLGQQMAVRKPDLVVVMLGGNEASYPTLTTKGGVGYLPLYEGALKTILAGSAGASCLVMTPLDQGYFEAPATPPADAAVAPVMSDVAAPAVAVPAAPPPKGEAKSRPGMANLVAMQAQAATNAGCAFWSSYAAMGGAGSALTWARTRGMGTGDLVHLTPLGLERIGNLFSDALLADYDSWARGTGGRAP
ncbi:MAG: hypothetical protein EXR69_13045 [Myxococcales bacterium]|nr:hypothetical protein [Myxococcales bacterium]